MTMHTPGPWIIDYGQSGIGGRDTLAICQRPNGAETAPIVAVAYRGWENGPSHANAALIAAAPEMLAALKNIKTAYGSPRHATTILQGKALEEVWALIAKVEGSPS